MSFETVLMHFYVKLFVECRKNTGKIPQALVGPLGALTPKNEGEKKIQHFFDIFLSEIICRIDEKY